MVRHGFFGRVPSNPSHVGENAPMTGGGKPGEKGYEESARNDAVETIIVNQGADASRNREKVVPVRSSKALLEDLEGPLVR